MKRKYTVEWRYTKKTQPPNIWQPSGIFGPKAVDYFQAQTHAYRIKRKPGIEVRILLHFTH